MFHRYDREVVHMDGDMVEIHIHSSVGREQGRHDTRILVPSVCPKS